ncbi:hypothetical protein LKD23_03050, partial [Faecalibacterium sp. CLA-AA-H233]
SWIQRVEIAGAFLVLFWHAKENISLNEKALCPAHRRASSLKENQALRQQKFDPALPARDTTQ